MAAQLYMAALVVGVRKRGAASALSERCLAGDELEHGLRDMGRGGCDNRVEKLSTRPAVWTSDQASGPVIGS
jgi:hypothetical protein